MTASAPSAAATAQRRYELAATRARFVMRARNLGVHVARDERFRMNAPGYFARIADRAARRRDELAELNAAIAKLSAEIAALPS